MSFTARKLVPNTNSFTAFLLNPPDFKIMIGDYVWHVHEDVLVQKSTFFRRMCSSEFQEAHTREVTLHDDDPVHVAQMIMWLYTGEFTTGRSQQPQIREMATIGNMLHAGFQRKNGENVVNGAFERTPDLSCLDFIISSSLGLYLMSDKYGIGGLGQYCTHKAFDSLGNLSKEHVWLIVEFVNTTGADTTMLRKRLQSYFVTHIRHFRNQDRFKKLIREDNDLAIEMFEQLARQV